jgi:hypothetical protein
MTGTRRYRFTLFWASVLVGLGVGVMALGVVTAGLIVFLPRGIPIPYGRPPLLVAAVALVAGFVVGAPLVMIGQLVQVFLDQRRLLASVQRSLRRWEDEREADRNHPMRGPVRPS